ncbi:hypothetical protein CMZ84_04195 [Lysobacteraceae bacterium NML93-0399]|nr:hypothetical protein CMZ84_04195 [Xanthomonadaceae bacterium NML93-0399]
MTRVVVAQRMWQRRGTAAEWEAKNPILEAGEIGVQLGELPLDPQMFKIGNGITPWLDLAFAGGGGGGDDIEFRTNATHLQWRPNSAVDWIDIAPLAALQGPPGGRGPVGPPGPASSGFPSASFDGGLSDIEPGAFADLYVPFAFSIRAATVIAGSIGNAILDVRVRSFALGAPNASHSICGLTPPTLIGANRVRDDTLADWALDVPADSWMRFVFSGGDNIRRLHIQLEGERT